MIISALAQLCAGSVGINSANVGISSFALLTAITHLYAKCVKLFYCTRNPILNHAVASGYRQDSCALSDSPMGPRPPAWLPLQQCNVQVAARAPLALGDVLKPSC